MSHNLSWLLLIVSALWYLETTRDVICMSVNVPLPPAACRNGPTINPPDNVQNCTGEDRFNKYYTERLCRPEQRQPYGEALNGRFCGHMVFSDYLEDLCSVDANGVPCGVLYHRSLADLASLDLICRTSDGSCTSSCRDGITAAKNRYGCCLG